MEMIWNVDKCRVLHKKMHDDTGRLHMNGVELSNIAPVKYLGIAAAAQGTASEANTKQIKTGITMLRDKKEKRIHSGKIQPKHLLVI